MLQKLQEIRSNVRVIKGEIDRFCYVCLKNKALWKVAEYSNIVQEILTLDLDLPINPKIILFYP